MHTTGVQWIVNGYLLSLSALFAFGGRLADIADTISQGSGAGEAPAHVSGWPK